jgi:hypothetical protein
MTSRQHMIHDLESGLFSSGADWFSAQLFRLIAQADSSNTDKLGQGYPAEVELYREFKERGDSLFMEIHGGEEAA